MNLVLLAVIIVVALNIVLGYSQGFVKAAYSLIAWILVLILTTCITPIATSWVMNQTPVAEKVEQYVYEQIKQGAEEKQQQVIDQMNEQAQQGVESLEGLELYGIQFPNAILEKLEDIQEELVQGEAIENIEDSSFSPVYKNLAATITAVVIKGVVSVIIMILAVIVVNIVGAMLDIVSKLPVLDTANKSLGIAVGAIKGFMVIWILFAILSFFGVTETGRMLINCVYENPILIWIYENNPLLTILFLII